MERRRKWTEEEELYLEAQVGKISLTAIAKHLNRTPKAVQSKLNKKGLTNIRAESGMVTVGELARLLKVERKTILYWIRCGLKSQKKIIRHSRTYTMIIPENFWKWAYQNKNKVNFFKIDKNALVPEPSWVDEERKVSYYHFKERRRWTEQEDRLLDKLRREGKTLKEIALTLDRTEKAINMRCNRICTEPTFRYWTPEEDEVLKMMTKEEKTFEEIAVALNRSEGGIKSRSHALKLYRAQKPWSPGEDDILAKMRKEGKTYEEIARALNRTKNSVIGRNQRNKGKGVDKEWSDAEENTLFHMRNAGYSHRRIGNTLGRSERAIANRWGKMKKEIPSASKKML